MKNKYLLLPLMAFFIVSCKTATVSIDVLKPAEINIPHEFSKITVINRSLATKGEQGGNIIEGLFTGEGIHQDRNASYNCVNNFAMSVNEAPKFLVNFAEDFDIRGTGTKEWPIPIAWDTVSKITKQYNTDLLIALETFDSDSRYFSNVENYTTTVNGESVTKQRYIEGVEIFIDAGWRIYDPNKKVIVDQNTFRDSKIWEYKADTQDEAKRKIPTKREAVDQAATYAGYRYAARISPTWATEPRTIFRTKNDQMKAAWKLVKQKNWNGAYKIWNELKNSEDIKIAAYALHNIALYNEFNDNIDLALQIANEAYKKFPNDHTARYINILTGRQAEINRLNEQLN
jgi:hypothetical protein